jgi:hypothetical protein
MAFAPAKNDLFEKKSLLGFPNHCWSKTLEKADISLRADNIPATINIYSTTENC